MRLFYAPPLRTLGVALGALLLWVLPASAKDPAVTELACHFKGGRVLVTFRVADALEREDIKEAIQSTRPITLTYMVEIRKNRTLWPDKTVAQAVLKRTVTFDNLTGQYTVSTLLDGAEVDAVALDGWGEAVGLLGAVQDLPVAHVGDLKPGEKRYMLRAKVHFLSDSFVWIVPKDLETDWEEIELVTP